MRVVLLLGLPTLAFLSSCYSLATIRKSRRKVREAADLLIEGHNLLMKAHAETEALRNVLVSAGCTVVLAWDDPETLRCEVRHRALADVSPTFGATTFGKARTH